jgi:hypothetical protein
MNKYGKIRTARCDKCYQKTSVAIVNNKKTCGDCDRALWNEVAEMEKLAWLKGT